MDGCVNNEEHIDSVPLIEKIKESYDGYMIAASSLPLYRRMMIEAGCTHESTKDNIPYMVKKLLNFG